MSMKYVEIDTLVKAGRIKDDNTYNGNEKNYSTDGKRSLESPPTNVEMPNIIPGSGISLMRFANIKGTDVLYNKRNYQ